MPQVRGQELASIAERVSGRTTHSVQTAANLKIDEILMSVHVTIEEAESRLERRVEVRGLYLGLIIGIIVSFIVQLAIPVQVRWRNQTAILILGETNYGPFRRPDYYLGLAGVIIAVAVVSYWLVKMSYGLTDIADFSFDHDWNKADLAGKLAVKLDGLDRTYHCRISTGMAAKSTDLVVDFVPLGTTEWVVRIQISDIEGHLFARIDRLPIELSKELRPRILSIITEERRERQSRPRRTRT